MSLSASYLMRHYNSGASGSSCRTHEITHGLRVQHQGMLRLHGCQDCKGSTASQMRVHSPISSRFRKQEAPPCGESMFPSFTGHPHQLIFAVGFHFISKLARVSRRYWYIYLLMLLLKFCDSPSHHSPSVSLELVLRM